jgi:hypothetical protein
MIGHSRLLRPLLTPLSRASEKKLSVPQQLSKMIMLLEVFTELRANEVLSVIHEKVSGECVGRR